MSTSAQLEKRILAAVESSAEPDRLYAEFETFLPESTLAISKEVETARISRRRGMYLIEFGEEFLAKQIRTGEDLLFVLLHEAFHHVLGHLHAPDRWFRSEQRRMAANIAADILVNGAVVGRFFFDGGAPLLDRLYRPDRLPGALLRRPSTTALPDGREVMAALRDGGYSPRVASAAWDIIRIGWFMETTFERLTAMVYSLLGLMGAHEGDVIVFLGDHPWGDGERGRTGRRRTRVTGLPWGDEGAGTVAGELDELDEDEVPEQIEPALSPELAAAVRKALVEDPSHAPRRATFMPATSPVFGPGRQDWPALATGFWPALFHGPRWTVDEDCLATHVYIDVSGSFCLYVARVYGLVLALHEEVASPVHLFSNEVADVTLEQLARGLRVSTRGTDFDCVLLHAVRCRYRSIVVITDGIGSAEPASVRAFRESGASLYLVLLGSPEEMAGLHSELPDLAREVWRIE